MKIIITLILTLFIIGALFWTRPDTHAELQALPPPTVNSELVRQADIQPIFQITGKLQPAMKTSLHFQVSGQVDKRLVEAGQRVIKGELLLSIEDGDFVDEVEESKAILKTEENAIERDSHLLVLMTQERELQEQEVARLKQLGHSSLASKSNYDQALQSLYSQQAEEARLKHNVDSARSRLMIEQARLNKAKRNLERTKLIAPFNGSINTIYVEVGDYVSPGQSAVEIVQTDQLDLNLEITGELAAQLNLGQIIDVETNKDERQGEIIALSVDPDPETNTHLLKIRLSSQGLQSGQLAQANLPGYQYMDATVVPIAAILYEDGKPYVFEVRNEHIFRKPVTLVERYHDLHIVKGIEPGISIVSRDVSGLADGQTVTVR